MVGKGELNSSSNRILRVLKTRNSISLTDLSDRLCVSKAAVLKKVVKLERQGIVTRHYVHSGNGRPTCMISIKNRKFHIYANPYEDIVDASFSMLKDLMGEDAVGEILERSNARMKKEIDALDLDNNDFFMKKFIEQRNEEGYRTEIVKTDDERLEIYQYNCPLISIAETFQSCCDQERAFLKDILKKEVTIRETIREKGKKCHFSVFSDE